MSLPITVPEARSRWKLTAIVAVIALVLSMLSLTAGQSSIAHAEDGSTRTISGVVSLPEGSLASLADVTVQATLDGSEEDSEPVAVAEDGSFVLSDIEPGAYHVEFVVSGESGFVVSGKVFGATSEAPEGQLVDVANEDRKDINVTLDAIEVETDEAVEESDTPEVGDDEAKRQEWLQANALEEAAVAEQEAMKADDPITQGGADISAFVSDGPSEEGLDASGTLAKVTTPIDPLNVTAAAGATRTISGTVTMQSGYSSWLSSMRVAVCSTTSGGYCTSSVKPNTKTGAWTLSNVPAGLYNVEVWSYDYSTRNVFSNYYPNTEDYKRKGAVDLRKGNVSGIKSTVRPKLTFKGKIAMPAGYSIAGSRAVIFNSRGEALDWSPMSASSPEYYFYGLPAGDYWVMLATRDSKYELNMTQFARYAGKTRITPPPGQTSTRNLTTTAAQSVISGKISVGGGLPKDFLRAANIYQRVDGIWFQPVLTWLNFENYSSVKLAQGEYTVEFTAKTGRDIAKGEWWNKKSSLSKANIIKLTGSNKVTGVNGRLTTGSSGQVSPFKDVLSNHKFYNEIRWMYTSGTSTGTKVGNARYYKPKDSVSREAMAAFMFRMNAPKGYKAPAKSPFRDISTKHKFYKEIAWMYTSGLSTGNKVPGGRVYSPKEPVSRSAMAAFMYRQYAKKGKYYAYFSDVSSSHKFYNEISWMKDSGISTGTRINGSAYYQPNDAVSREAMAAFLFRNALYR